MAKRQEFTAEQQSVRVLKVGERVRHILSELLARQEVHDEVVSASNIAVTEVRMTPDLRHATAYVKPLLGSGPRITDADVVHALRQNTAFLQREVAKRLGLKFAPKLKFRSDESFAEADRIETLLRDPKVARDLDEAGDNENGEGAAE
ncbi:ribosome-binding factor A [Erythrobacter sp. KY5]|uniref:30S ribosome-binding factor RbfA n=1 Tax=Erythrobacter sp. KY5 TaxID=2011159 RepID=UPI000DBF1DB2|nr:30S ribosome-binding factor RbfA [Erythrobacter sp. KY5]AWW75453.1 ribosome-binding factor A [Erythrobacter sp. KY5]